MKQYFKIGAARCKTLGIPEGTIFPVKRVETNIAGGKGFDAYVFLDNPTHYNGVYLGEQEMFAGRGEFVTKEDYDLQESAKVKPVNILQALGEVCEQVYSVRGQIRLTVKAENEPKVWEIIKNSNPQYGVSMRTVGTDGTVDMRLI